MASKLDRADQIATRKSAAVSAKVGSSKESLQSSAKSMKNWFRSAGSANIGEYRPKEQSIYTKFGYNSTDKFTNGTPFFYMRKQNGEKADKEHYLLGGDTNVTFPGKTMLGKNKTKTFKAKRVTERPNKTGYSGYEYGPRFKVQKNPSAAVLINRLRGHAAYDNVSMEDIELLIKKLMGRNTAFNLEGGEVNFKELIGRLNNIKYNKNINGSGGYTKPENVTPITIKNKSSGIQIHIFKYIGTGAKSATELKNADILSGLVNEQVTNNFLGPKIKDSFGGLSIKALQQIRSLLLQSQLAKNLQEQTEKTLAEAETVEAVEAATETAEAASEAATNAIKLAGNIVKSEGGENPEVASAATEVASAATKVAAEAAESAVQATKQVTSNNNLNKILITLSNEQKNRLKTMLK